MITEYKLVLSKGVPKIKEQKKYDTSSKVMTQDDAVNILKTSYKVTELAEEYVWMLALNSKGKCVGMFEVSHGTVSETICNAREILIRALLAGAVSIIIAHNHPSGDVTPSAIDNNTCKKLSVACKYAGIILNDFIIVGDGYYSYRKENKI